MLLELLFSAVADIAKEGIDRAASKNQTVDTVRNSVTNQFARTQKKVEQKRKEIEKQRKEQ